MFIINRCFKNIWLESQMIHVALFSFQRTTLSFEARSRLKSFASSDSFIVPHLLQTVKNFFIFLLSESSAPARRFQSRSIFLPGRCLAATCIILQDAQAFVNSFFKKTCKKIPNRQSEHCCAETMRDSGIHFSLSVSVIQL